MTHLYSSQDAQRDEAMRAVKQRTASEEGPGLLERAMKLEQMNIAVATDFLDSLSQAEREKYLVAEKAGKARKSILGRYGWAT